MKYFFSVPALALLALLIESCCMGVYCDCLPEGLQLNYKNASSVCLTNQNSGLRIETLFTNNNSRVSDTTWAPTAGCSISIPFKDNTKYWVIYSDSLALHDTIRILDVKLAKTKGCCSCTSFERLSYSLGQDILSQPFFTRVVP